MTKEESVFDQVFPGPEDYEPLAFEGATGATEDYTPLPAPEPLIIQSPNGTRAPSWKDRIANTSPGAGRQKKVNWDSSVLKYVKDAAREMGWKSLSLCREVIGSMRLLTGSYEPVALVIAKWDSYPEKDRGKVFSIDRAVDDCDVDRDEFAGLVLAAVQKHIQRQGAAIIDRNFEKIIQAAVDHAIHGGANGRQERVELLKILDRMAARERQALKQVPSSPRASAKNEAQAPTGAKSLDSQMAELDDIENIGVD